MVIKAFILIETKVGEAKDVISTLKQLEEIKSVDLVTGPYDVIATVEGKSLADVGDFVTTNINSIRYVSRLVTCIC